MDIPSAIQIDFSSDMDKYLLLPCAAYILAVYVTLNKYLMIATSV